MRALLLFSATSLIVACSSESSDPAETPATGGVSAAGNTGVGGTSTGGAVTATGGATPLPSTGGAPGTGGVSTGGAPATGGVPPTGGTPATGGAPSTGGASAGGGTPSAGGAAVAGGGSGGGSGGATDELGVAKALDGARIDAPCEGMPPTTDGSVCNHTVLMNNTFKATKEATLGGEPGATYDVKLRIRGVVEPTAVNGGMRPDTSTFSYKNEMWRKVPYTIGGTVSAPDYQAWSIQVESPKQTYYLNDYQQTAHNVFKLDYEITIAVAAGAKVTLDVTDANERQIDNYEKYELEGLPGSMNFGQFVQLDVVSVTRR